ncbi:MAG: PaaI family thioesterase [Kiritimatiellae bacterium]|nr:PaaI family thioesterase [Kiritimatiellia bacterium]
MKDGWLPWTKSCFVCGEENPHGLRRRSRLERGRVILDYTTRREDVGYRHIVHGGIAATLLDEVMTWAAIVATRKVCVAAELTTRLKAPIGVGQKVRVEGWVTRASSRLCLAEGVVRGEDGQELLTASGKYMPMPAGMASLSEKDFVHSPDTLNPLELVGPG